MIAPPFTQEQIERITDIVFLPKHNIKPCDALFVFGCPDPQIWEVVYKAYKEHLAKKFIISGGYNPNARVQQKGWTYGEVAEARVIADRLIELGLPIEQIIVEDKSKNSYENVLNSMRLFDFNKINSILNVTKETAAGRQYRTLKKYLPSSVEIVPYPYKTILNGEFITRDNWMNTKQGRSFIWQGYLRSILYAMKGDIYPVDNPIEELNHFVMEYWD